MTVDEAFEQLRNGFLSDRLAQAYVIVGNPREEGQRLAQRLFSLLFCTAGRDAAPCGQCQGCRLISRRSHPDEMWVEPQKKSRIISVDQIREELLPQISRTPYCGPWKACAMLFADRLNEAASNAFLKTLEEPPGRTLFLLLTDSPQSLLTTILSRCQRIVLSEVAGQLSEDLEKRLVTVLTEWGDSGRAAVLGRVLHVQGLAEQITALFKDMKTAAEKTEKEIAEHEERDVEDEVMDARVGARYREMRSALLSYLLFWQRDILILASGGDEQLIKNVRHLDLLRGMAQRMTPLAAVGNIRAVDRLLRDLESNSPERVACGSFFQDMTAPEPTAVEQGAGVR